MSSLEEIRLQRIRFLEAKVAKLERENTLLKAALTRTTIKAERSYRDMESTFDRLSKQVLETVCYLVKTFKRPATTEEVIKAFKNKYFQDISSETISRRLRYLRDGDWCKHKFGVNHPLLHSPQKGLWTPLEAEIWRAKE
ncbi:hypothetical protein DRO59_07155 [Candidatus Bathyarchaeota archaeon]|nr:MAG: hypothetical protein DRO59_07155 [Candidatus Bathyarchaeota archaeon]